MTEQRIDPALWRTVADELDRIAAAEWPESAGWLFSEVQMAICEMPRCPQRQVLADRSVISMTAWEDGSELTDMHRWHLRALAGALRAEAAGVEPRAQWHCPIGDLWCEHQQAHE